MTWRALRRHRGKRVQRATPDSPVVRQRAWFALLASTRRWLPIAAAGTLFLWLCAALAQQVPLSTVGAASSTVGKGGLLPTQSTGGLQPKVRGDSNDTPSSVKVFPPLVPEGEPESILGVDWEKGVPKFSNAPATAFETHAVAWSPDGKTLASACGDGRVRIWDATSGWLLRTLEGHSGAVSSVAWSPDGKTLASASGDKLEWRSLKGYAANPSTHTVRIWDAASGSLLRTLEGHLSGITSIAWSPDSKTLASASPDNTVRLWDSNSGSLLRKVEGRSTSVSSVAWSPDGKTLAFAGGYETVHFWDSTSGSLLRTIEGHPSSVWSVAWSPDGKTLASAGGDTRVRIWDSTSGWILRTLEGHSSFVSSVAWSPDGKTLASASLDNTVHLWDSTSGSLLRILKGHSDGVTSVAWSPDCKTLISRSRDYTVRLWDSTSGSLLRTLGGHSSSVSSVAWSPDGSTLASASLDNTVRIWDSTSASLLRTLKGHSSLVISVAWSPDGSTLASASADKSARLWDSTSGALVRTLDGHSSTVWSVAWSPDGKTLASASEDKTVRLWDSTSGALVRTLDGHSSTVWSVAWSPNGKTLASASYDNKVCLWDSKSGSLLRTLEGHWSSVSSVAWSPNGKTLASASSDGKTVRLWDSTSGSLLRTLEAHSRYGDHSSVAWSPNGKTLASSENKTVRLWDSNSGSLLRTLGGHSERVTSIAWSPDGKTLASASDDGTVRIWRAADAVASTAALYWAGDDGWITWRDSVPPERRVLRRENGSLLRRIGAGGTLSRIPPTRGQHPQLSAHAVVTRQASEGEMGEIKVTVANAKSAVDDAIWIELTAGLQKKQIGPPSANFGFQGNPDPLPPWRKLPVAFRPPATHLRLAPGESTDLVVGYVRDHIDEPWPAEGEATIEIHHAHDQGQAIDIPIRLQFRSPLVSATVGKVANNGFDLSVPVTLHNNGNQSTGRGLYVSAKFLLPNRKSAASDFKPLYDQGLKSGEKKQFSLPVPPDVAKVGKFQIELRATEGIAPGIEASSHEIGFVSHWTTRSDWLRVRTPWGTYLVITLGFMLVAAGVYYVRVYRDPIVIAAGRDPQVLALQPLGRLPRAAAALRRAGRLEALLGTLGLSDVQWHRLLDVSAAPRHSIEQLVEHLGARFVARLDEVPAARVELPPLQLRFGPLVVVALLEGQRVEPGQVQRLAAAVHETAINATLLLDLTEAQNGREAFGEIARLAPVVISSDALRDLFLAKQPLRQLELIIAAQRPLRELSPYRTAGGVEDAGMFFGRADELRRLADRELQNALLVGARQMGKSSLLKALRNRLLTRGDVNVRYRPLNGSDLMGELAAAVDKPAPSTIAEFQALVRGTRQRPNIWLIDEADVFAEHDLKQTDPRPAPLSWAMRALAEEGTAYFVLSGYWGLFRAAIFDTQSPLRNFGELMRLGPLDEGAARTLITQPMASLGVSVTNNVIDSILRETGQRANLLVLACQGLVERLTAKQRAVNLQDLERVWNDHQPLRDQLRYWRGEPLDRAVAHAALSLHRASRPAIEARLNSAGINACGSDLDTSFERLELGYVLQRETNRAGGPDQYTCPVPLIVRYELCERDSWEVHLQRDAEELRQRLSSHAASVDKTLRNSE